MGVSILIPGSGPGTGPILPDPLYSLGADDYLFRFEAQRLDVVNSSSVLAWPDLVNGLTMTPQIGTPPVFHEAGASSFVRFPGVSTTFRADYAPSLPEFTYAMLFRKSGQLENNFANFKGFVGGTQSSGGTSWVIKSSTGETSQSGLVNDTWTVVFGRCSATTPTLTRGKINGGSVYGPGTITAAPSAYPYIGVGRTTGFATNFDLASLVIWPYLQDDAALNDIYASIVAGSTLI